jgi:hypothetical protein
MNRHTTLTPFTTPINRNGKEVKAKITEWGDHITIEIGKTCLTIDKEDLVYEQKSGGLK